jgi:hypothetical protein
MPRTHLLHPSFRAGQTKMIPQIGEQLHVRAVIGDVVAVHLETHHSGIVGHHLPSVKQALLQIVATLLDRSRTDRLGVGAGRLCCRLKRFLERCSVCKVGGE